LKLSKQTGDLQGQANCIHGQGELARAQSDHAVAGQCYEQALKLFKQTGDLQGQANCIRGQGDLARMQSDHAVAGQCYEQALTLCKQTGDLNGQANCICSQGSLLLDGQQPTLARLHLEHAFQLYKQLGDWHGQALALIETGHTAITQSDLAAAAKAWQSAMNVVDEHVTPYELGVIHVLLARTGPAHERENHVKAAWRAWRRIDPTVLKGQAPWYRVEPAEIESVSAAP
jgi:tetratricopeptide (TPR) repeat protein